MDRGSIVAGAPFRAALYAAVLFGIVLAGTGWFAYQKVEAALQQNLESQILEEQVLLKEILMDGGENALGQAIAHLNSPLSTRRHMVGLFDDKGALLAGNVLAPPDFVGWKVLSSEDLNSVSWANGHLLNAVKHETFQTVVGRSLEPVNRALRTLINGLLFLGAMVFSTTLMLGYLLSRKSLAKLQFIEQTLDQVSKGEMNARLPVSSANDQIDRISVQVNQHLEQLSTLMVTTKSTVAAIAHDLKTPLSHGFIALQQAITQLDQDKDPSAQLEDLETELQRLSDVIDTILRISRIETTGAQTYFGEFDLNALVTDMLETFQPVASEKGQTLSTQGTAAGPAMVWADYKMLQQMTVNLISNAIAHCPSGTAITMGSAVVDGQAQLSVSDNGPGVSDELRARIFDPFFRTTSSRSSGGNGLGLALVRAIVTRHGATVRASNNHPGLRITVTFPKPQKFRSMPNL